MPNSIAIIDDDEDDLFFAQRQITKAKCGHPVVVFKDATEAIQHFEKLNHAGVQPSGVVFCDVRMPLASGHDVLKRLRELEACRTLPIYMLSGSTLDEDKERALALGANGYLVKFPTPEEFAKLIALHCK